GAQPMDLVDEEDAARAEIGEEAGQVAGLLDHRARRLCDLDAQLVRQDRRERGLAKTRRPVEQHVVEGFAALARRLEEDGELFLERRLPDELVEPQRSQPRLVLEVLAEANRIGDTAGMLRRSTRGCLGRWCHEPSLANAGRGLGEPRESL